MNSPPHPRILLVTRNLPPLVGGMERLNWHMAAELAKVAEVRIVGPGGSAALAPAGVPVREAPIRPLWKFLLQADRLARREAKAWRPDVIVAGSGLTAPIVHRAARACGARTATYVHGLDVAVKHPVYRALWLPAIRRMDRIIANSHATAALCRGIGVDPAHIGIVHPGVDLPPVGGPEGPTPEPPTPAGGPEGPTPESPTLVGGPEGPTPESPTPVGGPEGPTPESPALVGGPEGPTPESPTPVGGPEGPTPEAPTLVGGPEGPTPEGSTLVDNSVGPSGPRTGAARARERYGLGDGPWLLSVGRLSARKGLRECVAGALPRIVAAHSGTVLVIVGDAPKDALHSDAQTAESIRAAAERAGVADNLRFLGRIGDDALAQLYGAADVHVFPVREVPGDPEGFGMVAIESAAHGLPTVAFAAGGVVDAVANGRSGYLIAPGNYDAFADAVVRILDARDAMRAGSRAFAQQFAWPAFGARIASELGIAQAAAATGARA